jgi:hypothetical protein
VIKGEKSLVSLKIKGVSFMQSILSKLSPEEIKELSKALNESQAKVFGNPLSLRKQEQFMAELFKVKNWSTLLGSTSKETKAYDPTAPYQKTIVQIEILSNGAFPIEYNLETIHEEITDGSCSGIYKEISRTSLTKEDLIVQAEAQGSDPGFFLMEETEEPDISENEKSLVFQHLMDLLFDEQEEFYMDSKPPAVAQSLLVLFERERNSAINKYNRLNSDEDLDTLSPAEKILSDDLISFSTTDLVKRIKAHG